jgi:hypothetical protein
MRARPTPAAAALFAVSLLSCLSGCGGGSGGDGTVGPPETLDLAPAYTLTLIAGDTVPWHEPPPDERTYVTSGTVAVTPTLFKARWTGYVAIPGCPTCEPLQQLDSLYGPYTRSGPASFVVMIAVDRPMDVTLDTEARLHFREKLHFLGGIYEQVFTPNP